MNGGSIARFSRPHQEGVLEGTPVHKQLGATARGLGIARALDVPAHPKRPSGVVDRDQGSSEIVATASWAARVSLAAERRNLRRAGVLKNNPRTATVVPRCRAAGVTRSSRPPTTCNS